jgi:hypothetical protein
MSVNDTSPSLGHSAIRLVHQFRFKCDDRHDKPGSLTILHTMRFRHSDTNEDMSRRKKCRLKQICLTGYSCIESVVLGPGRRDTSVYIRLSQRRIRLQGAHHVSLGTSFLLSADGTLYI